MAIHPIGTPIEHERWTLDRPVVGSEIRRMTRFGGRCFSHGITGYKGERASARVLFGVPPNMAFRRGAGNCTRGRARSPLFFVMRDSSVVRLLLVFLRFGGTVPVRFMATFRSFSATMGFSVGLSDLVGARHFRVGILDTGEITYPGRRV